MLKKHNIDILSILGENDAFTEGHFELPCGLHIQSYIETDAVMQYPGIASRIAASLADLFDKEIDVVLAPTAENSILAQEVAKIKKARSVFAVYDNGVMKLKGLMNIKPEEKVLIVDNVTMKGRKIKEAIALVKMLNAQAIGVAVIVDRSNCGALGNVPLRSLLSYPLDTYEPANCPMCKAGIKLVKKGGKL